jgi:hypothetical protein
VLTPGLTAGIAPIDVYTGPARPPGWAPPAVAAGKKNPVAVAAKPPAAKPAQAAPPAKPTPSSKPVSSAAAGPKPKPAVPAPPKPPQRAAPANAQ